MSLKELAEIQAAMQKVANETASAEIRVIAKAVENLAKAAEITVRPLGPTEPLR